MNTDPYEIVSPANLSGAMAALKARLQSDYEKAYPRLAEIIHLVIDAEEANAWKLSFPHLFLPDLVEAHLARLSLKPTSERKDTAIRRVRALPPAILRTVRQQIRASGEAQISDIIPTQQMQAIQH